MGLELYTSAAMVQIGNRRAPIAIAPIRLQARVEAEIEQGSKQMRTSVTAWPATTDTLEQTVTKLC